MVAPTVFAPADEAAYAKGGNGGGRGGDKGNKGGNSAAAKSGSSKSGTRSGSTNRGQAKKAERQAAAAANEALEDVPGSLSANQKGRWNAAKANQAALDAHIRNGNFNGTIGALAQYQLAAKAASGAELTPEEQAALDGFVGDVDVNFTDEELEAVLNGEGLDGMPVYEVTDGVASCVADCDAEGYDPETIDQDANEALDAYRDAEEAIAKEQAVDDFYAASEQRILDESNKPTDGIEEDLLDGIASDLGVTRPDPVEAVEEEVAEGEEPAGDDPAAEDPDYSDEDEEEDLPPPPLL